MSEGIVAYCMDERAVRNKTRHLLERFPFESDAQYLCYTIDSCRDSERLADIGRYVEGLVFSEAFGNDSRQMESIYGPYEDRSRFWVSIDTSLMMPVGVGRIMHSKGGEDLLTLKDMHTSGHEDAGLYAIDAVKNFHAIQGGDECWDVGTLAVAPGYRGAVGREGFSVSSQLLRALVKSSMDNEVKHVFTVLDSGAYSLLKHKLGMPFMPLVGIDQTFEYYGSKRSRACYMRTSEIYDSMERKLATSGALASAAIRAIMYGEALSERGYIDTTINYGSPIY